MSISSEHAPEPRYGWVMVAVAGTFMMMAVGSMSALSVFMKPLTAEMGWYRGETSFAYLSAALILGAGGILMGHMSDRYSARPVVLAGAVILGAAYLLLARQGSLTQFYIFSTLMGLGVSSFQAPLISSVGNWFTKNKGLALGIASAWGGLGNGVVPFTVAYLISLSGWRGAYSALGVFALVVLVPLALLIRRAPAAGEQPEARGHSAERESPPAAVAQEETFLLSPMAVSAWLGSAAIFCCISMATPMLHLVVLAQDRGIAPQKAAGILLIIAVGSFFGRITYGRITDSIGGLRTYMLASISQTILVFWFTQMTSLTGFYTLALVYGFFYSGVMICLVICVREFVPLRRRGVSTGTVFFCGWLGMGIGGWQGGFFFDLTGAYTVSFGVAALAGVINLSILYSLKRYFERQEFQLINAEAPA
ncbi:MAG: MFS transporter [Nitrospinaceae bacterium]|nr:MFS transporter [Nitrospinaceae bacterium]MBT3433222.1 MFS transporter [Nitrospinaceae bacterium]MBT3820765.1 MFS transporter [Nitrospinaceae bacterium]MBT4432071.1 MFS transporter [Nitrospinaceae bacterium]MBT5367101.1 MFS transporter [Nitrospinaceae bacterium]